MDISAEIAVIAVGIQARTGSTRLPGKVLMDFGGEPMFKRIYHRCEKASMVDKVFLLVQEDDKNLIDAAEGLNIIKSRNRPEVVIARYNRLFSLNEDITHVVRVTADCPFVCPELIDGVVSAALQHGFATNVGERTFPKGLDVECFSRRYFDNMYNFIKKSKSINIMSWIEHVTLAAYECGFPMKILKMSPNISDINISVDTKKDYDAGISILDKYGEDSLLILDDIVKCVIDYYYGDNSEF